MVVFGFVMLTVRFVPTGRKPEMKPLMVGSISCAGTHGNSNVDWIAVWLPWVTEAKTR